MKILPQRFIKKGFRHTQMKREGDIAIYKRQMVDNSSVTHYEVVVITKHNGTTIEGNYIEPGELYPSSSQWGDKGWTCHDLTRAEQKFIEVQKRNLELERKLLKKKKTNK